MSFLTYDSDEEAIGGNGIMITGIPAHLRELDNGQLRHSKFILADYVLIGACPGGVDMNDMVVDYYGAAVRVKVIEFEGKSYLYFRVNQKFVYKYVSIYGMLTRHFTDDFGTFYGDFRDVEYLFRSVPSELRFTPSQVSRDWLSKLPVSKVSGHHHVHYSALEVWDLLDGAERRRACQVLMLPADATTTAVAGFMLWLASLDDVTVRYLLAGSYLEGNDMSDVIKQLKVLSVRAKSLQNIVERDLRDLFEAEVLVNRSYGGVDWAAEKKNRTEPDVVRISSKDVYRSAVRIFAREDATREMPRSMSWEQYFKTRWQWSAPGSMHSQYPEDLAGLPSDYKLRTKFVKLAQMPYVSKDHFMRRKPEVHAWASYKYEWSKMRAIYGTDFTSYIVSNLGFYNCEAVLPNEFPVGPKANDTYVRNKMASIMSEAVPFCVDFSDFNSQHSTNSMRAVLRAFRDVFGPRLHPDQIESINWTINSINNTVVHDNMGLKEQYEAMGTLLSGWRLTTFMNSVLNKVYMEALVKDDVVMKRCAHNGDDVIMGINSLSVAIRVLRNSRYLNVRLQPAKCALAGMAEFLRIDHRRGASGQYLTRNIATLMHSRTESMLATDWTQVLSAHEERLAEFVQRGGNMSTASRLRQVFISRRAEEYGCSEEDMYLVKRSHRVVGGLSTSLAAKISHKIVVEVKSEGDQLSGPLPGVVDYAIDLSASLGFGAENNMIAKIAERVRKATLKATSYTRHSVSIERNDIVEISRVHLGIFGVFSKLNKASKFGKAKSVGLVLDIRADDSTLSLIQSNARLSADPLRYISVTC